MSHNYSPWKIWNNSSYYPEGLTGSTLVQFQKTCETRNLAEERYPAEAHDVSWASVVCYREVVEPVVNKIKNQFVVAQTNDLIFFNDAYHSKSDIDVEIVYDEIDGEIDWSTATILKYAKDDKHG